VRSILGRIPSLGTVYQIDKEEWTICKKDYVEKINSLLEQQLLTKTEASWEKSFVRSMDLGVFYKSTIYALGGEEPPYITVNMTHMGTRRQGAWGRYVNFYYAYTAIGQRKKGYSGGLHRFLEELWLKSGLDRIKSKVASYGGFRLHRGLGHQFWGLDEKKELVIDSPLVNWSSTRAFPRGTTPRYARGVTESLSPYTPQQIVHYLTGGDCSYRISKEEALSLYPGTKL